MRKAKLDRLLQQDLATPRFATFQRLLDALLHHESQVRLHELKQAYEPFDPDINDIEPPAEAGDRNAAADRLFAQFEALLRLCNYRPLAIEEIEEALDEASDWGVNLHIDLSIFRRLAVYARHDKVDQYTRRSPWKLYRREQVAMPVYGRLALIFQLHDACEGSRLDRLQPEQAYLKLFKNIPKLDVDMLLPGARVRMSLLDQGKILLPTVTGLGMTAVKLLKGAVLAAAFAGIYGLLGFLALVGGTLGYGLKSFFGYQRTKEKYHLHLTRNLYYQNLANGRSVLFHLLDEAQEQEYQEAVLAYYLLWKQTDGPPVAVEELADEAEVFLRAKAGWTDPFEADDALAKLQRLHLASPDEHDRWRAVPLEQAIAQLDQAWDGLFQCRPDDLDYDDENRSLRPLEEAP